MNKLLTIFSAGSILLASGCAINNANVGYGGQPTGVVYSEYRTPGNFANPEVQPTKSGTACTHGVLWLAAWGNAGTDDAMKAAGITKASNIQYSNYSILSGLYSEYCTIVSGE